MKLQELMAENEDLKIYYHKNCVSRYTSKSNLAKYQRTAPDAPPPQKLCQLSSAFEFKEHCLIAANSVISIKIQSIQRDGDMPIYVAQQFQSMTKHHIKSTSYRNAKAVEMGGQMR